MEPDVGAAIQDALAVLKKEGATFVDVRFPPIDPVVGAIARSSSPRPPRPTRS